MGTHHHAEEFGILRSTVNSLREIKTELEGRCQKMDSRIQQLLTDASTNLDTIEALQSDLRNKKLLLDALIDKVRRARGVREATTVIMCILLAL
jgi:hypothetical protein